MMSYRQRQQLRQRQNTTRRFLTGVERRDSSWIQSEDKICPLVIHRYHVTFVMKCKIGENSGSGDPKI